MTTLAVLTLIAATIAVLFLSVSHAQFHFHISTEVSSLVSRAHECVGPAHLITRWHQLPHPRQRYLRYASSYGRPAIRVVRVTHGRLFRTKLDEDWLAIQTVEYFCATKPLFVWRATIHP